MKTSRRGPGKRIGNPAVVGTALGAAKKVINKLKNAPRMGGTRTGGVRRKIK